MRKYRGKQKEEGRQSRQKMTKISYKIGIKKIRKKVNGNNSF